MITAPAALGFLQAIYWHPNFIYDVTALSILKEPQIYSVMTNELTKPGGKKGVNINDPGVRSQRRRRVIHAPAYLISFRVVLTRPEGSEEENWEECTKILSIINRRIAVEGGTERPYLGIREHAASFRLATDQDEPWDADADLGPYPLFLHHIPDPKGPSVVYQHIYDPVDRWWRKVRTSGRVEAEYMQGTVRGGVMLIPEHRQLREQAR